MRVQTEEWRRFIPGVRMYKGKKTYFYNGEKLFDTRTCRPLIYNHEERTSWEVIIVLPGVEIIPEFTFKCCWKVKTVIMADTVRRIERFGFNSCIGIAFVKLSRNLELIGDRAFDDCKSLTSIYIPDSCRQIGDEVFARSKVTILVVPPHTELGRKVIESTPLWDFPYSLGDENTWIKSINGDAEYDADECALHRLCSSMDPSEDEIYQMMRDQGGLHAMAKENSIGITPSEYLASNPYADIDEMKLMKRFILENMGEIA